MAELPSAAEYSQILQNPAVAFFDPRLQSAAIARNKLNQPKPFAGNFAVVFEAQPKNGPKIAVRVFHRRVDNREEHYRLISEHLRGLKNKHLVGFEYLERGVRGLCGSIFPIVLMDWVNGRSLFSWLETNINNLQAIGTLKNRWGDLVDSLRASQLAHGDLQHGNVLIDGQGQIKLVDYDGMYVPKLAGRANLELGLTDYQHRERNEKTKLGPDLDNFSTLYIFVGLSLLEEDERSRKEFLRQRDLSADYFLFQRDALLEKNNPQLRDIRKRVSPATAELLDRLCAAAQGGFNKIPTLGEIRFCPNKVLQKLQAGLLDDALEDWQRRPSNFSDPKLTQLVATAQQAVEARLKLEGFVKKNDEAGMASLCSSPLLLNYPKAKEPLRYASSAPKAIELTNQLMDLLKKGAFDQFVELGLRNQAFLEDRPSCSKLIVDVRQWQNKNRLLQDVKTLLASAEKTSDYSPLIGIWEQLQSLGGHPHANGIAGEVDFLRRRQKVWQKVSAVPSGALEANDRDLVAAWDVKLLEKWPVAAGQEERLQHATMRLQQLAKLRETIGAAKRITTESENAICQAASGLPEKYGHAETGRVLLAKRRLDCQKRLALALTPPIQDTKLAEVAEELKQLDFCGAYVGQEARVELALKRQPILREILALDLRQSSSVVDSELNRLWAPNRELLDDCQQVIELKPRFELAYARAKLLKEIELAISRSDSRKLVEVASRIEFSGYDFPRKTEESISRAKAAIRALDSLKKSLEENDPQRFVDNFDLKVLSQFQQELKEYSAKIEAWVRDHLLAECGLKKLPHKASIQKKAGSRSVVHLSWDWPRAELSETCILAITKTCPAADSTPDTLRTLLQESVTKQLYNEHHGRKTILLNENYENAYASVWVLMKVGEKSLYSRPLVLGRLPVLDKPTPPPKGFFGWFKT